MNGDLLWHNTVFWSAQSEARRTGKGVDGFDFDPMFAALKPVISGADVAICQEEVPFAPVGGPYTSYPVFAAPPQIATWLGTMGYDACTTASNHSIDQGFTGLVRTATTLRTYEGITMRFTFTGTVGTRYTVTKAEYIPTLITYGDPIRLLPVVSSLASGAGPTARLQTARTAIAASVNLLGAAPGLVEA